MGRGRLALRLTPPRLGLLAGALLGVAAGPAPAPPPPTPLAPVGFDALPGWEDERFEEILAPLLVSCRAILAGPADRQLGGNGAVAELGGSPEAWRGPCAEAAALPAALPKLPRPARGRAYAARLKEAEEARHRMVREFLERSFLVHAAGLGILTGYYEPELRGAPVPTGGFLTPLHARPPEHVEMEQAGSRRILAGAMRDGRLQPLPSRAEIEDGALSRRGLELVWVDDPVDAFFLQIQGSGRVILPDGTLLRVGYAGQNGHPYLAIGRLLIEGGAIPRERMSMQAIRGWFAEAGMERAAAVMRANPSYVFFRVVDGLRPDQGPVGAMGVPLTPLRSVAVDRAHVPFGAPVFIAGTDPVTRRPLRRLTMAQDTGGAIRGPARGDLFWGWGAEAGERAGRMRDDAEFFLLLPRPRPPTTEVAEAAR
jgi:membrane-bound lytic murein transglycosylase A